MSIFHSFVNLPLELRHQIWIKALSDCIRPTAFLYKTNCWMLSIVREPDEDKLKFRHKELDHVPLKISLLSVRHEARSTALVWLHKRKDVRIQGNEELTIKNDNILAISKAFNPKMDLVYIPPKVFWAFCYDPLDLVFELANEGWLIEGENLVKKLAIHTDYLDLNDDDMWDLGHVIDRFYRSVNCIFMVVNLDTDPQFCSQGKTLQDQWTLDVLPAAQDCQESSQKVFYRKAKQAREAIEDIVYERPGQPISVQPVQMKKLHTLSEPTVA